ncbi:GreA/GreB family elongation factor [Sulfuriflexus mobilis]|uniref:GreA/GreB family elongation factor n=1 Tax=Sulfuriflexus mobilis TaxID=1811807 RepID=UPI000F824C37|nr:GreA/GreB family elongation factor [Sulfuriflexus mobilis]
MTKVLLLKQILKALEAVHQGAVAAALQASDTATHEENVAENKYDTLGLEAAYLAQGQAKRVAECEEDVAAFKRLVATDFTETTPIAVGAVVTLEDDHGSEQRLFLGPAAGGLKVRFNDKDIIVITRSAPLGVALFGRFEGDEVDIDTGGEKKRYAIISVD